jgi:hypothetical protein
VYLLLAKPILGLILLKREEDSSRSIPSNVTAAAHHFQIAQDYTAHPSSPLSNCPRLYSSPQLSTPPEIMIASTVHAADFCITAPRSLATTKNAWEVKKYYREPTTMSIPVPKGLRE